LSTVLLRWFLLVLLTASFFVVANAQAENAIISVHLNGAPEEKTETLLSGLSIVQQQASSRLSAKRIQRLHEQAADELSQMLAVYGYYNATITSKLEQTDDKWLASYQLNLGEPVKIENVTVTIEGEALQDKRFKTFLSGFPLKTGDVFNHESYESAKKSLLRLAAERGYFDGELTEHKVEINLAKNSADIQLAYRSGARYVFSDIDFPSTVVSNDLLLRLTPIKQGAPYLASNVLKLRSNLTNSGYFKAVSVTALIDERRDGEVKLDITLEPEAKYRYSAGLGFGTDSGARASLGWENRYVNNRGHRFSAGAKFSQIGNSMSTDYQMPFWSPSISDVGFNAEFKNKDTDSSQSRSFAMGSYYKTERWGWNETGAIKLLNENFDVSQDDNTSVLLIPSIAWSRTWADDTIYTRQGGRLSLSLSGASESILSDTTFAQIVLRGKYIQSITENGRFITRGALGATEVTDFTKLPSSLRFFAGGDSSIRGFDFESLGPKGDDGQVNGGRYLAVGSVEYEYMLKGNWGVAVFSDFGNAIDTWHDPIEYSAGVGIRWRSPIGLIRFDVAKGLSDPGGSIGFHVVIGPDL
jgi:translocation and assembly module TamA